MSERLIQQIKLDDIFRDNDFNCRGSDLTPADVVDLVPQIKQHGLIQPVVVTPITEAFRKTHPAVKPEHRYRLVAGFRRTMACIIISREKNLTPEERERLSVIDAVIRMDIDDTDAMFLNLAENLARKDLNILQESRAIGRLVALNLPKDVFEKKLGKHWQWVQVRLNLLELPFEVQQEVARGVITTTQIAQLRAIQRVSGISGLQAAVNQIREKRAEGKVIKIRKYDGKDKRRQRSKTEILDVMAHLRPIFGPDITAKALAWCIGEISTADFEDALQEECHMLGLNFRPLPTKDGYYTE